MIRVPFSLLPGLNKGTPKDKKAQGYYWGTWKRKSLNPDPYKPQTVGFAV